MASSTGGDVVDIALNSVMVQNWDRTLPRHPPHGFLEHSFRNWRGMAESGGRRIKGAVYPDQNSVRFLTPEEVERFQTWEFTNLGTFRTYLVETLRAHSGIHQEMILLVRQLSRGPEGIPTEVYGFFNDTRWGVHEGIQGDLSDHILAMVPEFGL